MNDVTETQSKIQSIVIEYVRKHYDVKQVESCEYPSANHVIIKFAIPFIATGDPRFNYRIIEMSDELSKELAASLLEKLKLKHVEVEILSDYGVASQSNEACRNRIEAKWL